MLKLLWLLVVLLLIYISLMIITKTPNSKEKIIGLITGKNKIDKEKQIVQIIERESYIGSNSWVTLVEVGEDKFAVFQSPSGLVVKEVSIDEITYENVWNKENIINKNESSQTEEGKNNEE